MQQETLVTYLVSSTRAVTAFHQGLLLTLLTTRLMSALLSLHCLSRHTTHSSELTVFLRALRTANKRSIIMKFVPKRVSPVSAFSHEDDSMVCAAAMKMTAWCVQQP
jgi:hypothetical protein